MDTQAAVEVGRIVGQTPDGKTRKREYSKRQESVEVMQFIASRDGATRLGIQQAFKHRSRTGINTTLRNLVRNKFLSIEDKQFDDTFLTVFRVNARGRHTFNLKSGSKSKAPLVTHNHVPAETKVEGKVQETIASPRLLESAGVTVSRVVSVNGVAGVMGPLVLSMPQARALHALLGEIMLGSIQEKE